MAKEYYRQEPPGCNNSCEAAIVWAGSLAVEVCCGALQHPQGVRAPAAQHDMAASSATSHADAELPLGPVPHMIRCYACHFHDSEQQNATH